MKAKIFTLVNSHKEKSGGYNSSHHSSTSGDSMSTPFIPSDQAQKLINSYTEVARASFDQMNEISRRAQSIHHIASTSEMNNLSTSLSDSSSNIPNELNLSDNNSRNINNSISFESTLPKKHISSQSTSASQSIETINTSNEYSQNLSDTINLQHSDNGLTVF